MKTKDSLYGIDWMTEETVNITMTKAEAFFILQLLREAHKIKEWDNTTPPANFAEKAHDIYIKRFYGLPLGQGQ